MVLNTKQIYMSFISANTMQTSKPKFMVTASITILVILLHLLIGWVLINTVYVTQKANKNHDTQRLEIYLTASSTIKNTDDNPANKVDLINKPTNPVKQITTKSTTTATFSNTKTISVLEEENPDSTSTKPVQSPLDIKVSEATAKINTNSSTITKPTTELSASYIAKPSTETTSAITPTKTNDTQSNVVVNNLTVVSEPPTTQNTKVEETITPVIKTTNITLLASDARWDNKPNLNVQAEINSVRTYKSGDVISVTFKLDVDKKGKITNAELINATKHSRINRRLIGQVKQGKFYPFTKQGLPVSGYVVLPFSIKVL